MFNSLTLHGMKPRSAWEVHHKDADEVGDRFALFALGSLANMAALNPTIEIDGDVPYLGHRVKVYEPWFAILWACIAGTHFAVTVLVMIWVREGYNDGANYGGELQPIQDQENERHQEESLDGQDRAEEQGFA